MTLQPLNRLIQTRPFVFLIHQTERLRDILFQLWRVVSLPLVFPFLVMLLIGVSLFPMMSFNGELDGDQSLFMAQTMRYEHDLVPWRSVDTTTSGPLNSWGFYLMRILFGPLSYSTVHVLAAVVMCALILLTWLTMRCLCEPEVAAFGALSACFVLALVQDPSIHHFTSELIPLLLLTMAVWMLAWGLRVNHARTWIWPLASLLVGAAPWAKLQVAPLSAALGAGLLAMAWWLRPRSQKTSATLLHLAVIAGGLSFATLCFLILIFSQGIWEEFWTSYIARNLGYAETHALNSQVSRVLRFWINAKHLFVTSLFMLGWTGFAGAWLAAGYPGWRTQTRERKCMLIVMLLYLGAGLFAMTKPPFNFPHYHLLVILPTTFTATLLLQFWSSSQNPAEAPATVDRRFNPAFTCFFFTVFLLPFAGVRASAASWVSTLNRVEENPNTRVARRINALAPNATSLGVWGWAPAINVHAKLMPATRHGICHFVIEEHPLREYFRKSYLEDLQRERPQVFVDAVTPLSFLWLSWKTSDRIESFPALHEFIRSNYRLAEDYPTKGLDQPYRIYILNSDSIEH